MDAEIEMTTNPLCSRAPALVAAARSGLRRGEWRTCLMSALVPGAASVDACVHAGWPRWLVESIVFLYDARVGAEDEQKAADEWGLRVAHAVSRHIHLNHARDRYLADVLQPAVKYDAAGVVQAVRELIQRRLAGTCVTESEWDAVAKKIGAAMIVVAEGPATFPRKAAWAAMEAALAVTGVPPTAAGGGVAGDDLEHRARTVAGAAAEAAEHAAGEPAGADARAAQRKALLDALAFGERHADAGDDKTAEISALGLLKDGRFDEATGRVAGVRTVEPRRIPLSPAAQEARRPPPPAFLLGAEQERPDIPAKARAARAKRIPKTAG